MASILIADDSPANRLALRLELELNGFSVTEAEDGAVALEVLAAGSFDAVVTDIWMPGADGIDVVRALRAADSHSEVFVVTGGGPGLSIASATSLAELWGASRVFIKPFDVRMLVAELKIALAARSQKDGG